MGKIKGLPGRIGVVLLTAAPANMAAITAAELAAGINLVGASDDEELASISGFKGSSSVIDTPGLASPVSGNVPGRTSYSQGVMTFYTGTTSSVIKTGLPVGLSAFVVKNNNGLAVGQPYGAFPVTVGLNEDTESDSTADMFEVTFGIQPPTNGVVTA